jgi:hypothetical protein
MARRPEGRKDDVLTREELKELQQRLSNLSVIAVEDFYRSALHRWSLQPTGFQAHDLFKSWCRHGRRCGVGGSETARLSGYVAQLRQIGDV